MCVQARLCFLCTCTCASDLMPAHCDFLLTDSGYQPHAPTWSVPHRRADRESPFLKPYLEANGEDLDKYPPQKPHAPDYRSLNRSAMPKRMPVPGYTGHVARTKDSTESFGTSHWRPSVPASRAAAAAAAKESAVKRGMMSREHNLCAAGTLSGWDDEPLVGRRNTHPRRPQHAPA